MISLKIQQNQTVVILGMHRSGTSLVAGILTKLHVNMGKKLLGKNISNPLGHFEDQEFIDLNDQILQAAGGSWDVPPSREAILAQQPQFKTVIENLIQTKESGVWGWKDPRTCLTIELYLPFLHNPFFIICHRDPLAIAESLLKRNQMEIDQGLKLAKIYQERVGIFLNEYIVKKRLDLKYEEMISCSSEKITDMASFLQIKISRRQHRNALKLIVEKKSIVNLSKRMTIINGIKRVITRPWVPPAVFLRRFYLFWIRLKEWLQRKGKQ